MSAMYTHYRVVPGSEGQEHICEAHDCGARVRDSDRRAHDLTHPERAEASRSGGEAWQDGDLRERLHQIVEIAATSERFGIRGRLRASRPRALAGRVMGISPDRWTCPFPGCGRTVVIIAVEEDFRCCLTAVQTMHGHSHRQTDTARTRRLVRALEQQDRKRRAS